MAHAHLSIPPVGRIIQVDDNTSNAVAVILTERLLGQTVTIKDGTGNAGTYNITITDYTGALFDGISSYVIGANWDWVNFYWNGNAWRQK
jgi:hypothetical protein